MSLRDEPGPRLPQRRTCRGVTATTAPHRRATALIVQSDPQGRELAAAALRGEGLVTVEAHSAERALEVLRSRPIDLTLLDLTLPDSHGLDLLAAIRRRSDVPAIVIGADRQVETRIVALRLGADDFVVAPVTGGELAARAAALLRRTNGTRPRRDVVEFGELVVDLDARRVRRGARELDLTPREFALLAFLVRHPDRVFTREQLLAQVWDSSSQWQDPSTVTEHVRKLRTKIEDDQRRPRWIVTVRRVGYRFDA